MDEDIIIKIFNVIMIIGVFILGWLGASFYKEVQNKRILNGLYFEDGNYSSIRNRANSLDNSGQWVCINVDETMDYVTAYKTCVHECGHSAYSEIFARKCDNDYLKCVELLEYNYEEKENKQK